jgi:chromate transporter
MLKTLWLLFFAFLKVGTFGYGGGPSMIPLIQKEVVEVYGWMANEEFIDYLGMGNALPGPIAIKMSGYIGYQVGTKQGGLLGGVLGAVMALLGVNLPGLVLMFVVALVYWRIKDNPKVTAPLNGAKAAVIGLLLWTTYELAKPVVLAPGRGLAAPIVPWDRVGIALVAFALVTFLKVHPIFVILGAALLGALIY